MRVNGICRLVTYCLAAACLFFGDARSALRAENGAFNAQVEIVKRGNGVEPAGTNEVKDDSNVVVWLIPMGGTAVKPPSGPVPQLVQHNKSFEPHVLVVQVGTAVNFPNKDPFFHNVFSLFDGKRFDLGLYEAGSSKVVRFDRPGVSFLFCNIHAQMSAVVIAVETPYFGLSDRSGRLAIPGVPDGRYKMHVWYERSLTEDLNGLERVVDVSPSSRSVAPIRVPENPNFTLQHKNKYGLDYVPPPNAGYGP